ncbi:MAG: MBL fold metallo-hydrolase [Candidatus Aenigmatarchaeota archaeon]
MAEIKVLVKGYARKEGSVTIASPSTVLIIDNGLKIIADPGANKTSLLESLADAKLKPEDIDMIFLTHYHLDHILNLKLFPEKMVLDNDTIYKGDEEFPFSEKIPDTDITVMQTPGHAHEHASLLVETIEGKIVIAGDLWWWYDNEEQKTDYDSLINRKDPYVKDEAALLESRKKVLEIADFVIPGHGIMFKVTRG